METDRFLRALESIKASGMATRPFTNAVTVNFIVSLGDDDVYCRVVDGNLVIAQLKAPLLGTSDLHFSAAAETWMKHWEQLPEAGWHDILGMQKLGRMKIHGATHVLMSNLQFFKDVLAYPRWCQREN